MAFRSYSHVYKRHAKCRANMKCGTHFKYTYSAYVASSRWLVDVSTYVHEKICTYANETSQNDYLSDTISIIIPSSGSKGQTSLHR